MRGASWLLGLLLAMACSAPPGAEPRTAAAPAGALTEAEQAELARGAHVARASTFERDGARYVGGVAYQIVEAPPHVVLAAVRDPEQLRRMLPRTRAVTPLDGPGSPRFEVRQGNDLVEARYTVVLEEDPVQNEIRFAMDPGAPHDIEDVYGYFRVTALEGRRSLVTVGVALDLGPGLIRMLFERRIQELMLTTPQRMRDHIERDAAAPRVAAAHGERARPPLHP
jgi:carbon monoxide dehydrogenase subunit G